jgi:prepilin-type N-terminal cleavage/methylation domain-containing protein
MTRVRGAFTLVEILIVVVILGILAALVAAQFDRAVAESGATVTTSELHKLRRHIEVYRIRNGNQLPTVQEGTGTWGEIVATSGQYLKGPPVNQYVGAATGYEIVFGTGPDTAYHSDYGWIYNDATGEVWAASFDANDDPLPKP